MPLYPLKFKPYLKPTVWGGDKILRFKGSGSEEPDSGQIPVGESWELSGLRGFESVVAEGELSGRNISELTAQYRETLLGRKVYASAGDEFPLLIKFIDAKADLSVQVHPDDALAQKCYGPGAKGKTEMWYVIGAGPGAFLYNGLKEPLTPEEYAKRVEDNSITEVLVKHYPAPGDMFFIPAGRIHAIGAGCFIAEIQQTSDTTYRIYDYGRPGLDGKPRELHTELAKEAIDYNTYDNYRIGIEEKENGRIATVSCPYFSTGVLTTGKPCHLDLRDLDSFLILICIKGKGEIEYFGQDDAQSKVSVRQGETVLIPACAGSIRLIPSDGPGLRVLTACIR